MAERKPRKKKAAPQPVGRRPLIAGNWKMNDTIAEGKVLVKALAEKVQGVDDRDIAVCPPFTALAAVAAELKGTNIAVGAQNVHWAESGAFTGEISAAMLKEIGVTYAVIGHSERRQYFGENYLVINHRAKAALAAGLIPIICVGESLEQREAKTYKRVMTGQVKAATAGLKAEEAAKCVIAYEPIWAIGTGKNATFEQAEEICAHIRLVISRDFGEKAAKAIRILYGGSVKPTTIDGLMIKPNVDGALVGGASLKADDFARIAKFEPVAE